MNGPRPPRLLLALLRLVAGDRADDVEGDLLEWMHAWARESGPGRAWLRGVAVAMGMIPGLALGSLRARQGAPWAGWSLDAKLALRLLWRHPGLSVTAVMALAVTMGLATAVYTITSSALWGSLPVEGGDRIVMLQLRDQATHQELTPTFAEYAAWNDVAAFDATGAFVTDQLNVALPGELPNQFRAGRVTASVFDFSPVAPLLGSVFTPASVAADPNVILLGESVWRDQFGEDPDVVGSVIMVNGDPHTLLGILPSAYRFPSDALALVPLVVPTAPTPEETALGLHLVARLAPGITPEAGRAQGEAALRAVPLLPERTPSALLVPYVRGFMSPGADAVFLTGVLVLVLLVLVAAANVANLVLARTAARQSELAVRTALGASRRRVVGQLFLEALALTAMAAALGITLSSLALGWLTTVVREMPYWVDLTPRLSVFLFSAGLAGLAAVTAGIIPGLRSTGHKVAHGLRTGGRGTGFGRVSKGVIVAELALSVALMGTALAMGQSFLGYTRTAYPLPVDEVLTANLAIRWEGEAAEGETLRDFSRRLQDGIRDDMAPLAGPGHVGFALSLPGTEGRVVRVEVEGESGARTLREGRVDPGFFSALGVEAVAGRTFTPADTEAEAPGVVVVNEPFVQEVLGGRNALGRRIRFVDAGGEIQPWREVVGVVPDLGMNPVNPVAGAALYRPFSGTNFARVLIRARGDPMSLLPALRASVMAVDPRIQVQSPRLLRDAAADERALLSGAGGALFFLGAMALLLSAAGLYAVLSFSVARRTRELGVRMALGADAGGVALSVVLRIARHLGWGLALGLGLGWLFLRATAVLPITVVVDPMLHLGVPAALLAASGLLAAWRPLVRALSIQPADALRSE